MIFAAELDEINTEFPDRLTVHHHLDDRDGVMTPEQLAPRLRSHGRCDVYPAAPTGS